MRALILGLCAFLMVFRVPGLFWDPSFFAEEATVWYWYAYTHSFFEALFPPRLPDPYYTLIQPLSTAIAANWVPVEYAPFVTLFAGSAVYLLVGVVVMLPGSPFDSGWKQALALLVILLVPPGFGRLQTIFSQNYLCIATGIILVSGAGSAAANRLRRGTLMLAGLTGVISIFLTPVFWLKFARQRIPEVRIQSLILSGCALFQLLILLRTLLLPRSGASLRFMPFGYDVVSATIFNQSMVHIFFGSPAMKAIGGFLSDRIGAFHLGADYYLLFALVTVCNGFLILLLLGLRRRVEVDAPAFQMVLCYLLVFSLSFVSAKVGMAGSKAPLISGHYRYFIAPNVFLALALLLHAFQVDSAWRARLYRTLVAWLLLVGAVIFWRYTPAMFAEGPSWREEVAQWREDESHWIQVWPGGNWPPLILPHERPRLDRKIVSPVR
jgi:hypothetical protein